MLRADKILLRLSVRRELGVEEKSLSEAELGQLLNDQGVHYVVMQPGFWTDLEAMRRFEHLMASPQFEEVARIPTPANHHAHETELVILVTPHLAKPIDARSVRLPTEKFVEPSDLDFYLLGKTKGRQPGRQVPVSLGVSEGSFGHDID